MVALIGLAGCGAIPSKDSPRSELQLQWHEVKRRESKVEAALLATCKTGEVLVINLIHDPDCGAPAPQAPPPPVEKK